MLQFYEKKGRKIYAVFIITIILIFTFLLFTHKYVSVKKQIDDYKNMYIPFEETAFAQEDDHKAQIDHIEGDVEVRDEVGAEWFSASKSRILQKGNEIRTLNNSRAIMTFDDGSSVRLDENTHITLDHNSAKTFITVNGGSVFGAFSQNAQRDHIVYVGEYVVTARNTSFSVQKGYEDLGVIVFEDVVEIKDNAGIKIDDIVHGNKAIVQDRQVKKSPIEQEDLEESFIAWNTDLAKENEKNSDGDMD
jgi:hypothetical protein